MQLKLAIANKNYSSWSMRAWVLLRQAGIAFDEIQLKFSDEGKVRGIDPYSPTRQVPVLIVDGEPVWDSLSICEAVAELFPDKGLWPAEPRARIAALEWLMFQMGGFGPMPGQVHHFIALEDEAQRAYGLKRFMDETRRLYGVMGRRLAEHEHFAGDLSIADFAILGWAWRHPRHKVDLADFPNVKRWYEALMARPGVQRGFAVPLRRAS